MERTSHANEMKPISHLLRKIHQCCISVMGTCATVRNSTFLITVYKFESFCSQLQFWLVAEFLFISAPFTTFQDSRPITRTLFLDWGLFTHLSLVRCPDVFFSSGLVSCVSGDRLSWASSVSSTSSSSDCTCPLQRAAAFWCLGLLWLLLLTWTSANTRADFTPGVQTVCF